MNGLFKWCLFIILILSGLYSFAQNWISGYEFRKKITFDKRKIEGNFTGSSPRVELDVTDFPVLVELQDEAFKYREATPCEGMVYDREGRI